MKYFHSIVTVGEAMALWRLADDGYGNLIPRDTKFHLFWNYGWGSGVYGL